MGGSGGGGSGKVSYPSYMEDWHRDILGDSSSLSADLVSVMNAASGSSPWAAQLPYDPDADLAAMVGTVDPLQAMVDLLSSGTGLDVVTANILNTTRAQDSVDAYAADLDARLTSEVIPRFERGMQDINAVTSSAFAIGRALLEENLDRQVAKYSADLNLKLYSDDALKLIQLKLEYQRAATMALADIHRIKIVAKKEEADRGAEIDEKDALWDLEVFKYGGNMLAAIGGGTTATQKPSTAQSVIGGALAGAAAGGMVGGPWGALGGAVLGAAAGLLR